MKINFDQLLTTPSGVPLKDESGAELPLKWICVQALFAADKDDPSVKMIRYKLAFRIDRGGIIDLDTGEISRIKDLIGKLNWGPLLVSQAHLMLERRRLDAHGNEVDA